MKHSIIACLLLLMVSGAFIPLRADDVRLILKEEMPNNNNQGPRSLDQVPVSCYVDEALGYIGFTFSYDFGEVNITIENLDTNALISVVADTADGGIVIPFSPAPGFHHISIVTASGTEYIGDFEI